MRVHVFSTKVLVADTILRFLLEMVTPFYVVLSTWRPCRLQEKGGTLISQWKTQSIAPAPGIKPKTSRSAVKRTTAGVNLPRLSSAVFYMFFRHVLRTEKETSMFCIQRLPIRHALNGQTFFAHLYLFIFFQWSTVTVFTVSSIATSTCSPLKLNSRKTDSRFKNCLLKHDEVEGTLRSHASPSSKMSV